MAFSKVNFTGELDGTTVYELNNKLDYSKTHLEDRMEVVKNILDNTDFYNQYFDNHFKASVNSGDPLSENINVCRSLERMASYILNSKEVKQQEDKEQTQYVFYTDRKYFEKKLQRECSFESIAASEDHQETIIHFLKSPSQNFKKPKTQVITKKDLERQDDLGEILRAYQGFLDHITNELHNPETKHNRYLLTKIKGSVNSDMIYCKDHLLGVIESGCSNESTKYDLDVFDFTNEIHLKGTTMVSSKGNKIPVKGLIYFKPDFDPNNEFSFVLMDLQNTIDKANLTDKEKIVLEGLRYGLTQEEIAMEIGTYQKKVSRYIDGIVKKIIKVGNKYDKREEAI